MKMSKHSVFPVAAILLVSFSIVVKAKAASEDDFEFVTIEIVKGVEPESDAKRRYKQTEDYRQSMEADKAVARAESKSMADNGYITASAGMVNAHEFLTLQKGAAAYSDIQNTLAYDPVARHLGLDVIRFIPDDPLEDGLVHDMITVLDHPSLGTIYVRERSLATEPRSKSKYLYGPKFDLNVNGIPALLRVYKSQDGKRGRTALTILSETRLLTLSAGVPLMKGESGYEMFMALANRL